jgi:hypothetical protein
MLAKQPRSIRYETFRDALIGALVDGVRPSRSCDLSVETRAVIDEIAARHPEANPLLVADAYDAFDRDQDGSDWRTSATTPHC